MIDLTPLDVRKKRGDFNRGMRGYDPGEVDGYLELVAERLETLVKENLTLKERSARLGEQVRSQEGRERAVQEALVTAQELREDILGQARREADLIQREADSKAAEQRRAADEIVAQARRTAQKEADRILEEARTRLSDIQDSIQELERRRVRFLKSFRSLLERELGDVEAEEVRLPMEEEAFEIALHGPRALEPAEREDLPAATGPVVDVREMAPDTDEEPQAAENADDGSRSQGTWTSAAVYDAPEGQPEDDATVRGA